MEERVNELENIVKMQTDLLENLIHQLNNLKQERKKNTLKKDVVSNSRRHSDPALYNQNNTYKYLYPLTEFGPGPQTQMLFSYQGPELTSTPRNHPHVYK